mgnify:CR=1 FL=1
MTDWLLFETIDFGKLKAVMNQPVIVRLLVVLPAVFERLPLAKLMVGAVGIVFGDQVVGGSD